MARIGKGFTRFQYGCGDADAAGVAKGVGGNLIGEAGRPRRWEKGGLLRELRARIKAAFDPNGILNPGTLFD